MESNSPFTVICGGFSFEVGDKKLYNLRSPVYVVKAVEVVPASDTRVTLYTAGQHCAQPCNVNTHSRAQLPDCILKMAAWQGFACGRFFTDKSCNTRAKVTFIIAHLFWVHNSCPCIQRSRWFAQNLSSIIQNNTAGLCAIGRAVCFQHGCVQFCRAVRLAYN